MTYQEELSQALGEAVTFDPQILRSYDHDLGEMPRPLMALINPLPDTVVAARGVDDVSTALVLAEKYKIPVTPRGQATSGYGGSIPCLGGMVLDLSGMNRILGVDAENRSVDVEPGVIWEDLSRALAPHGLDNRVCPTSAPSSTVGGWFAMGGVGVGSLRYGSIRDNVLEIDVVGVDGRVRTVSGPEMEPYCQTCGALGVIVRLRLACRPAQAMTPFAAWLPDAERVVRFLAEAQVELAPYSASVQSADYCALRAEADGHAPSIPTGFLVSLAVPEPEADEEKASRLARTHGGKLLERRVADREWAERFYPMRIKKVGPSILVGEFYIPLTAFPDCWAEMRKALPKDALGLEAFAVRDGRLAVLVYIPDDAGSLLYPLRMAKAMLPLRIAARRGGGAYATGMWLAALGRKVYGAEKYASVKRLKANLDPRDTLNPGKIGGPRLPRLPFLTLSHLMVVGSSLVASLAARLPYGRRNAS